ncbi:hypothetical protein BC938DRAFT_481643 [Jimgerdemannia flammicorona]|uniref:Uncharacterized protein n=1 Tax=Jimgerdemannia flammicorona TaxID=994334 RepID=A0A433QFV1_9FUNG|nr:hypothetical protein BC938DRAFT_481643 [Jimgerdemannia flammicorona]
MEDIEDLKPFWPLLHQRSAARPDETVVQMRTEQEAAVPAPPPDTNCLLRFRPCNYSSGSHKGTGIQPLRWTVPGTLIDGKDQKLYSICGCKYTKSPPLRSDVCHYFVSIRYCDATHNDIPVAYFSGQAACTVDHSQVEKLCTRCGWVPEPPSSEHASVDAPQKG